MSISEWNMRLKKSLEQASANYDPLTLKKVYMPDTPWDCHGFKEYYISQHFISKNSKSKEQENTPSTPGLASLSNFRTHSGPRVESFLFISIGVLHTHTPYRAAVASTQHFYEACKLETTLSITFCCGS